MDPIATFKIFSTGSINIFVTNINDATLAIKKLYPTLLLCKESQAMTIIKLTKVKRKTYKKSSKRIECVRCYKRFNKKITYEIHLSKCHNIEDVKQFIEENHPNLQVWSKKSKHWDILKKFSHRTKIDMKRNILEKQKEDRLNMMSEEESEEENIEEQDLDIQLRDRSQRKKY